MSFLIFVLGRRLTVAGAAGPVMFGESTSVAFKCISLGCFSPEVVFVESLRFCAGLGAPSFSQDATLSATAVVGISAVFAMFST